MHEDACMQMYESAWICKNVFSFSFLRHAKKNLMTCHDVVGIKKVRM